MAARKIEPLHRDDVPFETAEEIVAEMQKKFPGMKIVFAGDHEAECPPEIMESLKQIEAMHERSMALGRCIDCDAQMPNYMKPEMTDAQLDAWKPSPGWSTFSNLGNDGIVAWQCPECDRKESSDE